LSKCNQKIRRCCYWCT